MAVNAVRLRSPPSVDDTNAIEGRVTMNTMGVCRGFGVILGIIIVVGVVAVVSKYSSNRKITPTPASWHEQINNMGKRPAIEPGTYERRAPQWDVKTEIRESGGVRIVRYTYTPK